MKCPFHVKNEIHNFCLKGNLNFSEINWSKTHRRLMSPTHRVHSNDFYTAPVRLSLRTVRRSITVFHIDRTRNKRGEKLDPLRASPSL